MVFNIKCVFSDRLLINWCGHQGTAESMIMTCTIEKVLADARMLVNRLRDHDGSADTLIAQAQTLHKRVDAMKQVIMATILSD